MVAYAVMMTTSSAGRSERSEPRRSRPLSRPSRKSTNARSCGRRASDSMAAAAEPHSVTVQPSDSRQTASVLRMLRSSSTTRTRIARLVVFASSFNADLRVARTPPHGGCARGPNAIPSSQRTARRGSMPRTRLRSPCVDALASAARTRSPTPTGREREQMNEEVSHRAITLPAQLRDEECPDLGSFSRNHLQSALHPVPWLQASCRGGRAHGDTAAACEMQEMA